MKVRRFDPNDDLIIIKARVFGKHGSRRLALALDTAASHTHVTPDIIDELGYSPAEGEAITAVRSAIGRETGYILRVQRFESLGFGFIDGLLGLSFLKKFNYEIRSTEGRIVIEHAVGSVT